MHGRADSDGQHKSGRIELSVAHVAGSALAAVAAAVLASKLGVYGTILGAGVVSVVATAGGTVFQHLFRRTGEQIKEVRVQTRPTGRRWYAGPAESAEPGAPPPAPDPGEYGEPTTHGARPRVRRRHAVGAAAVFIAAMSVITGIEMFSGGPVSNVWGENRTGTTVSDSVSGSPGPKSTPGPSRRDPAAPSYGPGSSRGGDETPSPGASRGGGAGDASTAPTPDASGSSGSSGSGKGSGDGSSQDGGTGGATAPGTSEPAAPGPSRTPSGGVTEGGTDASGEATPTPGATGAP
ncbi:hypothetical protein [Streptomyces rapamycinicus]|uniref:Uncharacterized protein n=2 Tax=Streptomyces rapamycinicus TaxID=1226757 RepID=A0A3L8R1B8_STRRN|nr:hypothetical protein [Streptomyces rapamycinicus]MBB4782046.1 hypothetical protein [Streptomyces rapamycinicus]RLV73311.1 hypothetical protein D3C57_128835 [Streptomyces rapamycinicus NRRL 5491]UTO62592.1 hypothetical protein LJB45_09870 [Streptomyces rapamycinicus]UTP30547.1 hypothetical protein LIV37_14985 [Streptomyces rapamycinicus NRRL 5491]